MSTPQLITPELVRLNVGIAGDKHEVIAFMARVIADTGRADEAGLQAAMEAREAQFATGMPGGIAIPHCRTDAVNTPSLGFLRLTEPVDFGAKDGPADLIIGIAAPDESGSQHMKLLAKLSRALIRKDFVQALRDATTPEEVSALIMGVVEPDAVHPKHSAPPKTVAGEGGAEAPSGSDASEKPVLLAITSCGARSKCDPVCRDTGVRRRRAVHRRANRERRCSHYRGGR